MMRYITRGSSAARSLARSPAVNRPSAASARQVLTTGRSQSVCGQESARRSLMEITSGLRRAPGKEARAAFAYLLAAEVGAVTASGALAGEQLRRRQLALAANGDAKLEIRVASGHFVPANGTIDLPAGAQAH